MQKEAYFLLATIAFLAGQQVEEHIVGVNISVVERLVTISAPTNFSLLLPYYEYLSYLTANWTIPNQSLSRITADRILIFVEIEGKIPEVYFKEGGRATRNTTLILECKVLNFSCTEESNLTAVLPFYIRLTNTTGMTGELFVVHASLLPIGEFTEMAEEASSLNKTLASIKKGALELNTSDPEIAEIMERLVVLEEQLSNFKTKGAGEELRNITLAIEEIRKTQTALSRLSQLESTEIGNLTADEKKIWEEIRTTIASMKDLLKQNVSAERMNENLSSIEERINLLKEEIEERQKPIFEETYKTLSGNAIYSAVGGIALIIVVFAILMILKKKRDGK